MSEMLRMLISNLSHPSLLCNPRFRRPILCLAPVYPPDPRFCLCLIWINS